MTTAIIILSILCAAFALVLTAVLISFSGYIKTNADLGKKNQELRYDNDRLTRQADNDHTRLRATIDKLEMQLREANNQRRIHALNQASGVPYNERVQYAEDFYKFLINEPQPVKP